MSNARLQPRSNATGIVVVAASLLTFGLVMVASTTAGLDGPIVKLRFWETAFGRHAIFIVAGMTAILTVAKIGHDWLRWRPGSWFQPALFLWLISVGCLALVLVPGVGAELNGARRWLSIGRPGVGLSFQPSEMAKLTLVVLLAALLAGRRHLLHSFWKGVLPAAGAMGICVALVGKEDFGTAALLGTVGTGMLFVAGVRYRHLILLGIVGAAGFAFLLVAEPYRLERLSAFRNIWEDPRDSGYHPIQSLVTIASGGLGGQGLGAGVQKYGYLPECRSDFIFSVVCEELGLFGAILVVALFMALLFFGLRVVSSRVTTFGRYLAFGVTFTLALQAVINIAVVTVVAPTKGISLPLISAGGSGVLLLGVAVGLLVSVAHEGDCCLDETQEDEDVAESSSCLAGASS